MQDQTGPLAAEQAFFTSLVDGRLETLDQVVADDFILIDVLSGSEVTKPGLLEAMGSGLLRFDAIEPAEPRVRVYQATAVITGQTRMSMHFGETPLTVRSRYTHVYVEQQGRWRLVSAQGTQIASDSGQSST